MIITRTPFRVSFAGGGTDLRHFYELEAGAVVSTAITKYMYVVVKKRFEPTFRVSYSETEIVSDIDKIKHPVVREALKLVGITSPIEIVSIADIPNGTGLGSSSSFAVGVLNALYAYKGILKSAEELARDACKIEIDIVGEPIGKQDQYIAAYGGLRYIQFNPDETVYIEPILCEKEFKESLSQNLLLVYTGMSRRAKSILEEQRTNTNEKLENLRKMREIALEVKQCFLNNSGAEKFASLLHQEWMLKKELANSISNNQIDEYYQRALDAGALGGKLLGAGGGGFLLLCCPQNKREAILQALNPTTTIDFSFEPEGSKIIYVI